MKFSIPIQIIFLLIVTNPFEGYGQLSEQRSVFVKKIEGGIELDGVLDEAVWNEADKATDFWQMFPTDSLRSTNETEVKLLYDDTHIYILSLIHISEPTRPY